MGELKLIALDAEDLAVISAHLQDAVMQVRDMIYLPNERRFAAIVNRVDWASAIQDEGGGSCERGLTALRFERVLGAQLHRIDLGAKRQVMELLAIQFEPSQPPGGFVTLVFAGGGALRLHVECIEAEMRDLGAAWRARRRPRHPEGGPLASSS
jgi:hypothetical protein